MADILDDLIRQGYAIRDGAATRGWLGDAWTDWATLAAGWNDMPRDTHMADGGRYRRRRFAVFDVVGTAITRAPHQPHYQARVYNRLNGGFGRWFEPVAAGIADHPVIRGVIAGAAPLFTSIVRGESPPIRWRVELHQFRIEAHAGMTGQPTPEGIHRDGVDGALVMLVNRQNVASGVTQIFDPQRRPLGAFTLSAPGDTVFLDDARVFHGVTPIAPLDTQQPAVRDVLVVTFVRSEDQTARS